MKNKGFTIIELIIVIVVLGILTGTVLYKFGTFKSDTTSQAAVDQVIADIQYTQMLAMSQAAQRCISFKANSNKYTIGKKENNECKGEEKTLPEDIKADKEIITFTFNSLGEPVEGGGQIITVGGKQIKVWPITGKAEALND